VIGPGLPRESGQQEGDDDTRALTEKLLRKYPDKKWVIDGGSLQTITPDILPKTAIVTPHKGEFLKLFGVESNEDTVVQMAQKYNVVILSKGERDIVSNGNETVIVRGGNAGMTKGGTGDVLAGLVASLYAKNDAFTSACAASYINKKAGESLEKRMGLYFNASDLADEIPQAMKELL
jgi:NAD(P)H-hydrate epimerase